MAQNSGSGPTMVPQNGGGNRPTMRSAKADRRTITHRGTEVGEDNVALKQNVPDQYTPILEWTTPRKYQHFDYAAGLHPTKAELRTVETHEADGTTTLALNTNLTPVAGEMDLDDQPYHVVRVVDTTAGEEVGVVHDAVDYAGNTVELETAPASGNSLKAYPVISDGLIQYRAINQFDHEIASLDDWGTALHAFNDHDQLKGDSHVHLVGRGRFEENERLAAFIKSPSEVVWEDADYPDSFVSSFQQKVDVTI